MAYRRTPQIQARLDAQRQAILAGAAQLLAEQGYAGCSMAGVAARAGIASGTLYNHFTSKSDLLAELFRTVVTREVEAVRAAAAAESSALDRTTAVIETFAGRALKQPRRAYALLAEPVDPAVDELRLEFRRAFRDVIAAAVEQGVADGELPPQNPTVVAAALVGAIGEALVGPLASGVAEPDAVPTLIEFAHRAVGGTARAHA
ncbi:MAG TPA: TetR/AcrR family transcriptional regulator [Jatrophihabitans sp.]|jgi:AcrR family transcriptional regulator|uniref:TetR/AcrR family transcriptional regulator n=1 Tax=Jatrophihabitans sp. TaxID=1932789 RepID=UPI002DFDEDB9|nr:TetR/AcrR family transcriptional regulator [Jatrophihabitans sp.]